MKLLYVLLFLVALCQIAFSQSFKGLIFKTLDFFIQNAAFRWASEKYSDAKLAKIEISKNVIMVKNLKYTGKGEKELLQDIFSPF